MDLDRVLNGAPWTSNNYLLVIHRMEDGENPVKVSLTHASAERKKRLMFALGQDGKRSRDNIDVMGSVDSCSI
ncbi:hypothetical protein J1N35_015686 [Gossypium stocksii]|uniref:DUF4283 domain-containing protein n=1 Tax=Gossypium stocksii TaxID=47602 RepID=A0A9D4AA39_9ROSI|nr:hypothetical protein J1N35_015686 [Gossypium stocksii]